MLLRRAKSLVERLQDFARRIAGDAVVDRLRVAACGNQAILAKERKMLRYRGVTKVKERSKLADRTLALDQPADDQEPVPVGQHHQQMARLIGRLLHHFAIYFHIFVYS